MNVLLGNAASERMRRVVEEQPGKVKIHANQTIGIGSFPQCRLTDYS